MSTAPKTPATGPAQSLRFCAALRGETQNKPPQPKRKGPRYTPVSRRHERPSAILWLVRNHPELKDAQIMRLVGTTKTTIASVRDRTHWNA